MSIGCEKGIFWFLHEEQRLLSFCWLSQKRKDSYMWCNNSNMLCTLSDWVFYRTIMGILIKPIGPHWYFKYFYFYQKIEKNDGRQYIFPRMFVEGSCVKLLQNQVSLNKTWHSTVRWTKSLPSNIGKLRNTSFHRHSWKILHPLEVWNRAPDSKIKITFWKYVKSLTSP